MKGILRPPVAILMENTVVPDTNLVSPAPNQFTHELIRAQPFSFNGVQQAKTPDGQFPAGTQVVLLVYEGGKYCRVVDGQGLYVEVEYKSLKRL